MLATATAPCTSESSLQCGGSALKPVLLLLLPPPPLLPRRLLPLLLSRHGHQQAGRPLCGALQPLQEPGGVSSGQQQQLCKDVSVAPTNPLGCHTGSSVAAGRKGHLPVNRKALQHCSHCSCVDRTADALLPLLLLLSLLSLLLPLSLLLTAAGITRRRVVPGATGCLPAVCCSTPTGTPSRHDTCCSRAHR